MKLTPTEIKEAFGKKAKQGFLLVVTGKDKEGNSITDRFETISSYGNAKGFSYNDRGYEYLYPNAKNLDEPGVEKRWIRKEDKKKFRAAIAKLKTWLEKSGVVIKISEKEKCQVTEETKDSLLWKSGYIYIDKPVGSAPSKASKSAIKEARRLPDRNSTKQSQSKVVCELPADTLHKTFSKLHELSREEYGIDYWNAERKDILFNRIEDLSSSIKGQADRFEILLNREGMVRNTKNKKAVEFIEKTDLDDFHQPNKEVVDKLSEKYAIADKKRKEYLVERSFKEKKVVGSEIAGLSLETALYLVNREAKRGTESFSECFERLKQYSKQIFTLNQEQVSRWVKEELIVIPEGFPGQNLETKEFELPYYKEKTNSTEFACFLQLGFRLKWMGLTVTPLKIDNEGKKYLPLGGGKTVSSNLACYGNKPVMQLYVPGELKEWQENSRRWKKIDSYTLLSEGIAKPVYSGAMHGVKAIGAMGHTFTSSPEQLRQLISQSRALRSHNYQLIIPVDAGAAVNPAIAGDLTRLPFGESYIKDGALVEDRGATGSIAKTIRLIREWQKDEKLNWGEFPIKILWYGQAEKARTTADARLKGDLDEIKTKLQHLLKSNNIDEHLLEYEDWAKIAQKHQIAKGMLEQSKADSSYSVTAARCKKNGWNVQEVNTPKLANKVSYRLIPAGTVTAIASPMATGKTELFEKVLDVHKERARYFTPKILKLSACCQSLGLKNQEESAYMQEHLNIDAFALWLQIRQKESLLDDFKSGGDGSPIFVVQTLNSLSDQTAERLGISHREDLKKENGLYGDFNPLKECRYKSLCINSIRDISLEKAVGALLVFDEFESIMDVLFCGSTCKDEREQLVNHLRAVINICTHTGGRVVLMDANLTSETLTQFDQLLFDHPFSPQKAKKNLIVNTYENDKSWNAHAYLGSSTTTGKIRKDDPSELQMDFCCQVASGKKCFFASDSKLMCQTLFCLLAKNHKGLLITGDDKDEDAREFLKNPNLYLKNHPEIQFVIVSPSVESGVSITRPFFDYVYGCFFGVTSASSQIQMLGRVRATVDRKIWVNVRGIIGAPSAESLELGHMQKFFTKEGVLRASRGDFRHSLQQCYKSLQNFKVEDQQSQDFLNYVYGLEPDATVKGAWTFARNNSNQKLWESESLVNRVASERIATKLRQSYNLREELIYRLERIAKSVTFSDEILIGEKLVKLEDFQQSYKKAQKEVELFKATRIARSQDITDKQAEKYLESDALTPDEQFELKKWLFKNATNKDTKCTRKAALMFMVEKSGRRLKQAQTLAIAENLEAEKKILSRELFFAGHKSEESIIYCDQKRAIGALLVQTGLFTFLNDADKAWSGFELNRHFKNLIENPNVKDSFDKLNISTYGLQVASDLSKDKTGANIAKKLLQIVGMKLKLDDGIYYLDDSETRGSDTWCRVYKGVQAKLKKDAEESVTKINKKLDKLNEQYATELVRRGDIGKAEEVRSKIKELQMT